MSNIRVPQNPGIDFDFTQLTLEEELALQQLAALGSPTGDQIIYRDIGGDFHYVTLGSGITLDGGTLNVTGSGSGDVVGPIESVNNSIVIFDGLTGKVIKDSSVLITDVYTKTDGIPVSSGLIAVPSVTDNGDGTVTIGDVTCRLFTDASGSGPLVEFIISGGLFLLTDNTLEFAVVDYNLGSPYMYVTNDVSVINETTVIPVLTLFRDGLEIHAENLDELGLALPNKLHRSIVKTQRFRRESGLSLSESVAQNVIVSSGVAWRGAVEYSLPLFDSSIDELHFYYRSSGNWTKSTVSQYNNTQYDDGTDLQTLGGGKYAVNYVYRCASYLHNDTYIVLGGGDYNLNQAIASQPPSSLPPVIRAFGILVGRIIVLKNSSTATQIDSAFVQTFTPSPTTVHNDLSALQGGFASEYFHLTTAQHTIATQVATGSQSGYLSSADWTIFNNKQNALGFTPENVENKSTSVSTDGSSDTKYPSVKAVKDYSDGLIARYGTATYSPASGAQVVALDCTNANMHVVTCGAVATNITFTVTGTEIGRPFIVSVANGAAVSTIAAWFATVRWAGGLAPTFTAIANKRDTFGFIPTGSNTFDGFVIGQNA